jgi:hypothetical protein
MLTYDATRLKKLYDHRWGLLGNWRLRWNDIAYYIMPSQRSGFTTHLTPGTDVSSKIYDSTAMEANDRLSNRLHEALTNPSSVWFGLKFRDEDIEDVDANREWLDDCQDKLRQAIRESNFDMIMGQFYLDLGAFGSAGTEVDEKEAEYDSDSETDDFRGFMFRSLHLGSLGLAESSKGLIDQVFEKFDLTAEQWLTRFGDKCPEKIRDAYQNDPDKVFAALKCRFKRTLPKVDGKSTRPEGPLVPLERPWAEVWVSVESTEIVEDGGTYEQASFIGRWRKKSDDIMGYGPGERALPTVRSVNEAERLELAAWAKQIDPPIKTKQNNIVGDANLASGGVTVVRNLEESKPWEFAPDLNHHMTELEDKRFQIRDIFKYHALELPAREQVGQMTAYEIAKRSEAVYRSLGPVVVQLKPDVLDPMLQRCFNIMYRKKAFLPMPEGLQEQALDVEYVGPMAQAAKQVETDAIDRFMGDALALKNSGIEEAMDIIDLDKAQRYKANLLGVPAKVLRSNDEVEAVRKTRNDAKQQAMDEQSALMGSEAAKNIGQAGNDAQMKGAVTRMVPQAA